MKDKEPIFIEEPYTCTACGRQNLKYEEISYKEKHGQIDLSTVVCINCGYVFLLAALEKHVIPEHRKDVERILKQEMKRKEHNYNRRLVRRVLKKKE
jgi:C4-type Zn-finger protein